MKAWSVLGCLVAVVCGLAAEGRAQGIRAGAAGVDVSPVKLPVIINGGFQEGVANKVNDPVFAKALVLESGGVKIAVVVVDSCMLPRELLDGAKEEASKSTGIPAERMLISATHTHSAPAAMGCLGSDADAEYVKYLPGKLVEVIEKANGKLAPAKVGWGVVEDWEHAACRRWIRRPDRMLKDPFGELTVRANMHPGFNSPDAIGPAGPIDPGLSVLAVQSAEGRPVALLANYSMHYFSAPAVSADYFGRFCRSIAGMVGAKDVSEGGEFVAMMSQGTSGDTWLADYSKPARTVTTKIDEYAEQVARRAFEAYRAVQYKSDVTIAMAEAKLKLNRRVPSAERLEWARGVVKEIVGGKPKGQQQVYAREQIFLHEEPVRELKLQAIRIGDLGITGIPNEVYAITGLKLKAMSPLAGTFNVSLANGSEGYIPPPEQHHLGGYTTWAARTAGLEVEAEPKIVEGVVKLLEEVAGKKRREWVEPETAYSRAVLASKPIHYLRLSEVGRGNARDAGRVGQLGASPATFEPGVAFYVDGVAGPGFAARGDRNRAVHLAGGRVRVPCTPNWNSIELWFWSGMPNDAREVTGYLFSFGREGAKSTDELLIGGKGGEAGRLIYRRPAMDEEGRPARLVGKTVIEPKAWHHVVLVNAGGKAVVYVNGKLDAEGALRPGWAANEETLFVGGSIDGSNNFEGKIDEVAVYDRALSAEEVAAHYAAGVNAAPVEKAGARGGSADKGRIEQAGNAKPQAAGLVRDSDPVSPEESLKKFHLMEGYEIELVAAEPLVMDPVAIDWGADGRLWVVEMADYPYGVDGKMKPGGRVKVLEDVDGDGKYDKAQVFLEGVNFPNGILVWRKGVIVTAAPDIFYAEDTDGDGRADVKQVLYRGFKEGNPQLRVNGLRWGLDGWVYCANGLSGGAIVSEKTGKKLDIAGRDLRIKPDTGEMELVSGASQFGRNRDDWGNWFGCDNSHPLFHYVLEDRYTRRNPHVALPDVKLQLMVPANPRVFSKARTQKRYHSFYHETAHTSACSANVYRDRLLFEGKDGTTFVWDVAPPPTHVFVCEPVHNLVHHEVMTESGVSFSTTRPSDEREREFLASEDPWFRPVMNRTGPDGALWVVDMYRYMIEHPDWLPAVGQEELRTFFRDGEDRGRVYRIYPKGKRPGVMPRLDKLDTAGLVELLKHQNGWVRDAAQMMLVWKRDPAAKALLERLWRSGPSSQSNVTALTTLDLLGQLDAGVLREAIYGDPQCRKQAIRILETRGAAHPELVRAAAGFSNHLDMDVLLQLALSLGEWETAEAGPTLGAIAVTNRDDPFITSAVLSSSLKHYRAVVEAFEREPRRPAGAMLHGLIATALGQGDREILARLLGPVFTAGDGGKFGGEQLETFGRFLDLLVAKKSSLEKLREGKEDALAEVLARSGEIARAARGIAADESAAVEARVSAVQLLGRDSSARKEDLAQLGALVEGKAPTPVQTAAVKVLARVGDESTPGVLARGWGEKSPAVRFAAIDALISREPWAFELLKRIEAGEVAKVDVDLSRRQRLLRHSSARIKELAARHFGEAADPSRQKIVEEFRGALAIQGDVKRGKKVFGENCSTCHRMGGVGNELGPDLRSVQTWSGEAILTAILDPDRNAEPRFVGYNANLTSGETVSGIVVAETGNAITVRRIDGQNQVIPRSTLKSLQSTNRSFMPVGFESALSERDVADVIRYLQAGGGN